MAYDYKAFISYSHAADGQLAPELQHGLQKFACPWTRLRAIHVFRDKTGLTVNPDLWQSIVTALDTSEYFLLLASPQAAQSHWVNQEVQHWLSQPRANRLLIILTAGEILWNADSQQPDTQHTNALPPALQHLTEEPLWIDLRWAKRAGHVSLQNPRFLDAVADLSSTLRGIPKDQLIGDDVRQHRRATLFRRFAITSLILLTVGLAIAFAVARQQRNFAIEQARIAVARQLAAQSELIRTNQPERYPLALLMATEATRSDPSSMEAQQSLQSVLSQLPEPLPPLYTGTAPVHITVDPHLTLVVTSTEKETIVWRLPDRQPLATLPPFDHVTLSTDGKLVAGCCDSVEVWTWDGRKTLGLTPTSISGAPQAVALSRDGTLLAIGFIGRTGPGFEVRRLPAGDVILRREIDLSGDPPALAFAPNGDLAVTMRDAVEMLPFGASTVTTLASKVGALSALTYSTDGRYLAWSSGENVTIYDFREQKESARLIVGSEGPSARVSRLVFSADSQYLGAIGELNTGAIWRGPNWREVVAPRHAELQTISALTFHPSAPEAVTCGSDGYCLSWSLTHSQKVRRFAHIYAYEDGGDSGKRQIIAAEFGGTGSTLVTSGVDGTVRLWNLTTPGEAEQRGCVGDPVIETFAPVGRQWSWPIFNEPVLASAECQGVYPPDSYPGRLVRDLTGEYVAFPRPVDIVSIWSAPQGILTSLKHDDPVDWEAVQQRLIDQGHRSYRAYRPIVERMQREGSVEVRALSPSAKYLITERDADNTLRMWDVAAQRVIFHEQMSRHSQSLFDFLSEDRLLRVDRSTEGNGSLTIFALPTVTAKWTAPAKRPVAVTISEDKKFLAWADERDKQRTVRVQEVATGTLLFERTVELEVKKLYFDSHHRFLVMSVGEQSPVPSGLPLGGGLVLWRISDRKELIAVPETNKVIAFGFSSQGEYFAAVNRDGQLHVWDLAAGTVTSTVLRNPGPLAFSASGTWIAAGSGSVQILDRTSLRSVAQLDFTSDARHIDFRLNDRIIAVTEFEPGNLRGVTRLRHWQPADLLAEACRRLPRAAAKAQWQQLFVDRPLPDVCSSLNS